MIGVCEWGKLVGWQLAIWRVTDEGRRRSQWLIKSIQSTQEGTVLFVFGWMVTEKRNRKWTRGLGQKEHKPVLCWQMTTSEEDELIPYGGGSYLIFKPNKEILFIPEGHELWMDESFLMWL